MNECPLPQAAPAAAAAATPRTNPRGGRPRLVAFDYDGTITTSGRPSDDVLAALARARAHGLTIVLATGRILAELVADFPDVDRHFDALVVENGAEVTIGGRSILVAPPIDATLAEALTERHIAHRCGNVIIAAAAVDEHAIVDELISLGLECQLTRNRAELMILPSGVNKGLGLLAALGELGISPHDSIAVGDAENDHSLLGAAELGIAVANAVDSLRAEADVTLGAPAGDGVIDLVDDLTGSANVWRQRRRPQLTLGHSTDGQPIRIPARPANIIITGGSGDGKSYLAGLVAEQLVDLKYSVLVVDPEGDHVGLDALRPAVVLGDDGPPPPPDTVVSLLKRSDACVVVDLSTLTREQRLAYLADLPAAVESARLRHGRPHWVFIDEAHQTIAASEAILGTIDLAASGYCLITWRPDELARPLIAGTDIVLALTTADPDPHIVDLVAAVSGRARREIAEQLTGPTGRVLVAARNQSPPLEVAHIAPRHTEHIRHEHKYDAEGAPPHRAFWLRDDHDHPTGAVAHNLHELGTEISHCDRSVLRHHAPLGDFSRWINDVFHDRQLAATVAAIEATVRHTASAASIDTARLQIVGALNRRHH